MTTAAEHWRVCAFCVKELEALGASRVPGPHVIDLEPCEAHGETGVLNASAVVSVPDAVALAWRSRPLPPLAPLGEGDRVDDVELVASLAARLLGSERSADHIAAAVLCARRLLATSRGL